MYYADGVLGVALLSILAAAAPARPRVLVLDLKNDGAPAALASALRDGLTSHLDERSEVEILSSEDVRRAADVAADRASVGCDTASCLAELAGAVGAEYIVYGNVAQLGELYVVTLNLMAAREGKTLARQTVETRVLEDVPASARKAGDALVDALLKAIAARASSSSSSASRLSASRPSPAGDTPLPAGVWIGGGVFGAGALLAAAGTAGAFACASVIDDVTRVSAGGPDGKAKEGAQALGLASVGAAALGGAGLVAGGVIAVAAWQ